MSRKNIDKISTTWVRPEVLACDESARRAFTELRVDIAHMSRLLLALPEVLGKEELRPAVLSQLLDAFVKSHHAISESSHVKIRFGSEARAATKRACIPTTRSR